MASNNCPTVDATTSTTTASMNTNTCVDTCADTCVVHCVGMSHVEPGYRWNFTESIPNTYGFVEEPTNPHDPNAVMVVRTDQENRHVGYVAKEFTRDVKNILQQCELLSIVYESDYSNSFRRVLRLRYVSPALLKERALVGRLKETLKHIKSEQACLIGVRLFRPWDATALCNCLPLSVKRGAGL